MAVLINFLTLGSFVFLIGSFLIYAWDRVQEEWEEVNSFPARELLCALLEEEFENGDSNPAPPGAVSQWLKEHFVQGPEDSSLESIRQEVSDYLRYANTKYW